MTRPGSTKTVASVQTDRQGHFRLALAPGSFLLHPTNTANALQPRAGVVVLDAQAGSFRQLTIRFDSGIRGPVSGC